MKPSRLVRTRNLPRHESALVVCWLLAHLVCSGQGTVTITFDGSPTVARGSEVYVQSYYESGYYFTPLPGSDGFIRQGGGPPQIPDNGTAYLQASAGDSLQFHDLNNNLFSMFSADVAGYSTVVPDFSVPFVGYLRDGSTVRTNFSSTGINFRTVHFGPEFSGLQRVEIPGYAWSLDNLVLQIPEPSASRVFIAGAFGLWLWRTGTSRKGRAASRPLSRKIVVIAAILGSVSQLGISASAAKLTGSVIEWGDRVLPVVPTQTRFKSIASGYEAEFGLTTDGLLIGWYNNSHRQIPPFGQATNIVAVSAYTHTLALKSDGTVLAWGDNSQGQCNVPPGLSNVIAISATCGWYDGHSLALKSDGTVVAWGDNFCGESNIPDYATNIIAVAAGPCESWLLRSDGTVIYIAGQTNAVVSGLKSVVAVTPNMSSTDAGAWMLEPDGSVVYCRPLAQGVFTNEPVAGVSNIVAVSGVTYGEVYFLQSDGTVLYPGLSHPVLTGATAIAVSSGGFLSALLADGSIVQCIPNFVPERPFWTYTRGISAISAGDSGSDIALKPDGTTVCGAGFQPSADPFLGPTNVIGISAGYGFDLALKSDGTVVAWGDDSYGQCTVPAGLTNVVAIAAGGYHGLALTANGSIVGWGDDNYGQAQDGWPIWAGRVAAISAGALHSLALGSNGIVSAWGYNYQGQCNVPSVLTNIVAISAGGAHNLVLRSDGTVAAWGYNNYGQCNIPPGLSNVIAIAAGGDHSLALRADGSIVAWGSNDYGEGNVPNDLGPAFAISAGFNDSMALVLPIIPSLRDELSPQGLVLSWPSVYAGFKLQSSPTINPPYWTDCTNSPFVSSGQFFVTNSTTAVAQFFRLAK